MVALARIGLKNFGEALLGDARRTTRLVHSAAQIAAHPEKSFNQIFDWDDLRGFYRLCNQKTATVATLQQTHWDLTRQEMGRHPLVLILHDTTEADFTAHFALQGAGPIGDGGSRGFLQHNSLAVVPDSRQVLGLAFQQWHVRKLAPPDERSAQRKRRQRESQLWIAGIEATGQPPEGCRWVDVGDRGADIYEAMVAAQGQKHEFLFRVAQDRQVWMDQAQTKPTKLLSYARSLASWGNDVVDIPGRGGRAARQAAVELAAAGVWIPAPTTTPQRAKQPVVAAWVVRIWEPNPPEGVEPLEWVLVTSVFVQTLADLRDRRDWYGCRWMVETYHDILKNGCSEEDRRFETAGRLEACLAILSVIAVRIFQLRTALNVIGEKRAEEAATAEEVELVRRLEKKNPQTPLTVRDFVRGVARLGGFLGRKGDGDPGVKTLWRGYQRLQDLLLGYQLYATPPGTDVGNR